MGSAVVYAPLQYIHRNWAIDPAQDVDDRTGCAVVFEVARRTLLYRTRQTYNNPYQFFLVQEFNLQGTVAYTCTDTDIAVRIDFDSTLL